LGKSAKLDDADSVRFYKAQFGILNVNSMLTMFFESDARLLFRLEEAVGHDELYNEWKKAIINFERQNQITVFKSNDTQRIISGARNKKIKSIYKNWKTARLTDLLSLFPSLLLSNRRSVIELVFNRQNQINAELVLLSQQYNPEVQSSKSGFLKNEINKFIDLFILIDTENAVQNYDSEINTKIDNLIDSLADIVISEYQRFGYFQHNGDPILFIKYLEGKYLTLVDANKLQSVIIDFAKGIFNLQINSLAYNQEQKFIECDSKIDFIFQLNLAYNDLLKNRIVLNDWKVEPSEEKDFLSFKALFEAKIEENLFVGNFFERVNLPEYN
jgi:hypothetical protein